MIIEDLLLHYINDHEKIEIRPDNLAINISLKLNRVFLSTREKIDKWQNLL